MNRKHWMIPGLLLVLNGCANALGLNDKRVLSDPEYQYFLDTGEIPDEDTDLSAYEQGAGGTSSVDVPGEYPYEEPGTNGGGSAVEPPGTGGRSGETFAEPDSSWDDVQVAVPLEALGEYSFEVAELRTDTLSGWARPASSSDNHYPREFFPEQDHAPYCVHGEYTDPLGYGAITVTARELSEGTIEDFHPTGLGLIIDAQDLSGRTLVVRLLTSASPETGFCRVLSGERPEFVAYEEFEENCETGGGLAYDPSEPYAIVAVTTSSLDAPGYFNFCLAGLDEMSSDQP